MKKNLNGLILFCTLLFTGGIISAQSVPVSIKWSAESSDPDKFQEFGNSTLDLEHPEIPLYTGRVRVDDYQGVTLELEDLQYTDLRVGPESKLAALKLGAKPELKFGYGASSEGSYFMYSFYPFVKVNGRYKQVSSFKIKIKRNKEVAKGKKAGVNTFKTNSVLNSGDWYKFSVDNSGIYKITPGDLANAGIDVNGLAGNSIRVFGNGDGMLPASNDVLRKDDLNEINYKLEDNNNNGIFDGSDYLLFYAAGPHVWNYNEGNSSFSHILNNFRDNNYYFISVNNGSGQIIQELPSHGGSANNVVNSFDDFAFKEDDLENLVGSGKRWLGDVFDFDLENNYGFNFPDLDKTEPATVRVAAAGRASDSNTFMSVLYNGAVVQNLKFSAYGTAQGADYVNITDDKTTFNPVNDNFTFLLRYNNDANPSGVAWLDFIEVQVRRNLTYRNKALFFRDTRSVGPGNVSEFVVSNTNQNVEIWDVTDVNNVFALSGQVNGSQQLNFKVRTDSLRQFVAVSGSDFPSPAFVKKVESQNLHSMTPADMIIVTHNKFLPAADRLAQFHIEDETRDINVKVVTVEQIYNEFSSGGQDITAIRDFMRMLYERNTGAADDLKYLLLFGDGSYDYRDRISNNNNYVPLWQGGTPFSLYYSRVGDDYYGFLDPGEGTNLSTALLDLGIGRIPCESLGQAQAYVDKVINYAAGDDRFGDWRNKILLMTDDVDESWETAFVRSSERLEGLVKQTSNSFIVEKIYTDAYKQVSSSGSETYPEASKDMFRKVQQGNLVTNYIGHGGEIGLSSEKLLQLSDINAWTNFNTSPLFMTITCEFTRFDDPKRVSAGEQLILNSKGGAIGLISTTRVVFADPAIDINEEVFNTLLTRPGNIPRDLGEIVRDAKNNNPGTTRLKFSLFGDPSLKLAIPYYRVQTNSLNGKPVASGALDTLKALSKVVLTGQVNDHSDQKLAGFNGILNVSVFDKASKRQTLKNDGQGSALTFDLQNNLIYKGKVEVKGGDFKVEFLVPVDIAYQFGFGKVSYYAEDGITDASGVYDTILVGGFNKNAASDEIGPEVRIFMNDESFVRGGITGSDPELYAVLVDSSGINTVGNGIGHDLVAILDGNSEQSYVINEYYEADLNSYKSGKIRYPFYDLETGSHSLKLKVFDVYNNFTQAETEFVVADDEELALEHVLNYPNPFTTYTEFQFEHNRANQPLDIQVQVLTVSGKLVKTINTTVVPTGNRITGISWNGLDDYGDKIGKGVYVYRVKVRSQLDNTQAEKYEKLVILR